MGLWFECGLGCESVGKNVGESAKVRVSVGEGVKVWVWECGWKSDNYVGKGPQGCKSVGTSVHLILYSVVI